MALSIGRRFWIPSLGKEIEMMVKARARCRGKCGDDYFTSVTEDDVWKWVNGSLVQDVWPDKTADEREIIMQSQLVRLLDRPAGYSFYMCPPCGDELFGEDND